MNSIIVTLLSLFQMSPAHASALVVKNTETHQIEIISQINYFGTVATEEIAKAATTEISRLWNEPKAVIRLQGQPYEVHFRLGYRVLPSVSETDSDSPSNESCGINTVEIADPLIPGDRSNYSLLGNEGRFLTSDNLGTSTTSAHEFGHGLGLLHNSDNQIQAGTPGIMFARGTLVNKKFQWDQNVEPGDTGGTLNPIYRHVRTQDIAKLRLEKIKLDRFGRACIGHGRPVEVQLENEIPVDAR